jgi:hypothetical protein
MAIQLRTFFYSAVCNTATGYVLLLLTSLTSTSRQQSEVTPVVPFKNKIQYYQLKQPFLITPYFTPKYRTTDNTM